MVVALHRSVYGEFWAFLAVGVILPIAIAVAVATGARMVGYS